MIMIVGGAYQGKLDFALSMTGFRKEDFADGRSCGMDELKAAPGVFAFHEFVRRTLEGSGENRQLPGQCGSSGEDSPGYDFDFPDAFARELAGELIRANPELVVITDEIGCGIVPMDAGERIYRECAGRVCTELAAFSGKVYRVSCGIGVLIKDEEDTVPDPPRNDSRQSEKQLYRGPDR